MILAADNKGWTILTWACYKGQEPTVRLLLFSRPELNAIAGLCGGLALSWSIDKGHREICQLLIARGADEATKTSGVSIIDMKDMCGWTPIRWAVEKGEWW